MTGAELWTSGLRSKRITTAQKGTGLRPFIEILNKIILEKFFGEKKIWCIFIQFDFLSFVKRIFWKNFFILFKFRFVKVFVRFLLLWNFRTNFYVVSSCFSRFCHLCSRWSPLRLFSSFPTNITILTTNKCGKCPSSIQWVLGFKLTTFGTRVSSHNH